MRRSLFLIFFAITACQRQVNEPVRLSSADSPITKSVPVESAAFANLRGRVTFAGPAPIPPDLMKIVNTSDDRNHCIKDPASVRDETWLISKDGGVANVAVWIRPPEGRFFKLPTHQTWKDEVVIDTPFCAFVPRVTVAFPACFDGKKMIPTGQHLERFSFAPSAFFQRLLC